MARAQANKEYNTFIRGLVTEANPLTFPDNASVDEDNFILERNGSRSRRFGIDFEANHVLKDTGVLSTTSEGFVLGAHTWRNINDIATLGLVVVQHGLNLYFYDLFEDSISSAQKNLGDISNPTGVLTIGAGEATTRISVEPALGRLILVNGSKFVYTLLYDSDADIVIIEKRLISIRDLFGVDDNLEIDNRPSTLSQAHSYNLQNQGWTSSKISSFKTSQGFYPSNADIWTLGKDSDDNFDATLLVKQYLGSTPAPKGHKIIDAFTRGSSRVEGADASVTEVQPRPIAGDVVIGGGGGLIDGVQDIRELV